MLGEHVNRHIIEPLLQEAHSAYSLEVIVITSLFLGK